MDMIECAAFMLIQSNRILAEKRKSTKKVDPSAIAIPGGHIENGESPERAIHRELSEELGIVPGKVRYICTLLHQAQELQKVHYFAIESWTGNIQNHEAESLLWTPINKLDQLDLEIDRIAVSEYLRIFQRRAAN